MDVPGKPALDRPSGQPLLDRARREPPSACGSTNKRLRVGAADSVGRAPATRSAAPARRRARCAPWRLCPTRALRLPPGRRGRRRVRRVRTRAGPTNRRARTARGRAPRARRRPRLRPGCTASSGDSADGRRRGDLRCLSPAQGLSLSEARDRSRNGRTRATRTACAPGCCPDRPRPCNVARNRRSSARRQRGERLHRPPAPAATRRRADRRRACARDACARCVAKATSSADRLRAKRRGAIAAVRASRSSGLRQKARGGDAGELRKPRQVHRAHASVETLGSSLPSASRPNVWCVRSGRNAKDDSEGRTFEPVARLEGRLRAAIRRAQGARVFANFLAGRGQFGQVRLLGNLAPQPQRDLRTLEVLLQAVVEHGQRRLEIVARKQRQRRAVQLFADLVILAAELDLARATWPRAGCSSRAA